MTSEAPQTAAELGLMKGSPPPSDKEVTFWNWEKAPFHRWSFQHVGELVPAARVWRGDGPVSSLEPAPVDLDAVTSLTTQGEVVTVPEQLERTYTDGLLALHHGRVATERYFNAMTPATRHLLMSVSKSVIGTLAGVVIGRGQLTPDDLVVDVLTELRGTSFEGATVRHLLDMRTGTHFIEDYEDPSSDAGMLDWVADWGPPPPGQVSPGLYGYVPTLSNDRAHGGTFEYRSILTDVLGWVLARAADASVADLLSEAVWAPLGAQEDAEITVDHHGGPWVDGGICATLRDMARFGQMHLDGGFFNDRQIVPAEWVHDTRLGGPDSLAAFAGSEQHDRYPLAFYRNQWWVIRPDEGVYMASGIHGQFVYVNVPAQVVIVKLSTLPMALDDDLWLDHVAMFDAIAATLAGAS
jgi:CubicO group peptidase (beta-lactamase class C family)